MENKKTNYNTRNWLNPLGSYATSYISCFDGKIQDGDQTINSIFISISDCYKTMRIYKADDDTLEEFTNKLTTIISSLQNFIIHLNGKENGE